MIEVTLYTKPGCHLCESVGQVIEVVGRGRSFRLVVRNILEDEGDYAQYHEAIPVVFVNGREVARYAMTHREFEAALAQAAG